MKIKVRPILFIISIGIMCGYKFISLPYFLTYVIGFAWFFYAITRRANHKIDDGIIKLFLYSYIVLLIISPFLYIINPIEGVPFFSYLTRLVSIFLQSLSYLALAYAAWVLFGGRAIDYSFYGLVINNIIGIMWAIYRYGLPAFFSFISNPFSSQWNIWVREGTVSNALELHEVTFSLGFFLIYYLLFVGFKRNKLKIVVCIILIILGFKRIQMGALVSVILVAFLIRRKKNRIGLGVLTNCIMAGTLVITLIYIYILSTNYIMILADRYNINFMSRLAWFDKMREYYLYSPLYLGRGWGATSRIVEYINQSIHSDLLRCFIDFGFIGYICWAFYYLKTITNRIMKRDIESAKLYICFIVYAFVTYATDNTLNYPVFQYCLLMIVLCCINSKIRRDVIIDGEIKGKQVFSSNECVLHR